VVSGHDQQARRQRLQGAPVERRRTKHAQRCDAIGVSGGEALPIAAGSPGEMGAGDAEMVEKRRQASLDRRFF
jgi:hypothetical protein